MRSYLQDTHHLGGCCYWYAVRTAMTAGLLNHLELALQSHGDFHRHSKPKPLRQDSVEYSHIPSTEYDHARMQPKLQQSPRDDWRSRNAESPGRLRCQEHGNKQAVRNEDRRAKQEVVHAASDQDSNHCVNAPDAKQGTPVYNVLAAWFQPQFNVSLVYGSRHHILDFEYFMLRLNERGSGRLCPWSIRPQ